MQVFISWSGDRSRSVAVALHENLNTAIQKVDPFMSSEDIRSGAVWIRDIGDKLERSNYGIVCLTPTNLRSAWIHFEAGALAKNVERARVCCYLIGVDQADVGQPLSMFQNRSADEEDTWKMLKDINATLPDLDRIDETKLRILFDRVFWPALKKVITDSTELEQDQGQPAPRTADSKLDELLNLTRSVAAEIHRLPESRNPLTAVHRRRLEQLEQSGQIQELNYEIARIRTDDLLRLGSEIGCGAMCDAIFQTLRDRHGLSNEMISEMMDQARYGSSGYGGSGVSPSPSY